MTASIGPGDWSLTAEDLDALTKLIAARRPAFVVELGAGWSTLVLAKAVAAVGGTLTAVEHDPTWAANVRESVLEAGFRDVHVVGAPLEPHPLAPGGPDWYAEAALGSLPATIDLLIVDGPPGGEEHNAGSRYPALPSLLPRLAAGAVVVLDDVHRPGEQAVLARWEAETGFRFDSRARSRIAVGSAA